MEAKRSSTTSPHPPSSIPTPTKKSKPPPTIVEIKVKAEPNNDSLNVNDRGNGKLDVGEWTADKREKMIERLLEFGLKAISAEQLAFEFGLTKTQVRNATQAGRKGNLRDKACKAVRGD